MGTRRPRAARPLAHLSRSVHRCAGAGHGPRVVLGGLGVETFMPMPNLRDATPAQRARAVGWFVAAFVLVVIVLMIVR